MIMKEKTIFPREEKSEVLFDKILMTHGLIINFSRHSVTICFAMMILKQYFSASIHGSIIQLLF